MSLTRSIVIVGGGFSGTLVAANLLTAPHGATTQIVLIERSRRVARGKAYVEREHPYLLNVPAGRMSARPHSPLDFLWYARRQIPDATTEDFLPRALYGEYLESTLAEAEQAAPLHVRLDRLRGEVCEVKRVAGTIAPELFHAGEESRSERLRLRLADGRCLMADEVVLALGNPPAASVPGTEALHSSQHYVADPWAAPLSFHPDERLLLIGTSLTMADVATAAATATNGSVLIHAMSRRGLVPPSQAPFGDGRCAGDSAALLRAASFSTRALVRRARELADETERQGGDWREAVAFVRGIAPALWRRLPMKERRRLLRHVKPYWDVHRHRLPGETLARLHQMRLRQKLHVHAGRLLAAEIAGGEVRITWRPRGARAARILTVDRVINCTGPDYNVRRTNDALMRSLLTQGLVVPDSLGLGICTGPHGALIDSAGRAATNLYYIGPLLRADHWEATAAHELRGHAEGLARHLASIGLPLPRRLRPEHAIPRRLVPPFRSLPS